MISPSALPRAHACPASPALPQTPEPPGEAAEYGTRVHAEIEAATREGTTHPALNAVAILRKPANDDAIPF